MPSFNVYHRLFKESVVQHVSLNRNVQNNDSGHRCCLSLVESVMVRIPGGVWSNLKVLIALVDMLFSQELHFHEFKCS